MSDKINDGGPMFPSTLWEHLPEIGNVPREQYFGLTVRAHFAGEALKGLCANPDLARRETGLIDALGTIGIDQFYANLAVRRADALIKELEKK